MEKKPVKLNRLQRYTAYCIMLAEAENPSSFINHAGVERKTNAHGICFMASGVFSEDPSDLLKRLDYHEVEKLFPEYFPKFDNLILTEDPTWPKRIKLLKQCISETHPDNRK